MNRTLTAVLAIIGSVCLIWFYCLVFETIHSRDPWLIVLSSVPLGILWLIVMTNLLARHRSTNYNPFFEYIERQLNKKFPEGVKSYPLPSQPERYLVLLLAHAKKLDAKEYQYEVDFLTGQIISFAYMAEIVIMEDGSYNNALEVWRECHYPE